MADKRFVTPATLYQRMYGADFVLLGEVHANPDHHALQGRVIERLVAAGRRPAVVFEMFERNQQAIIERAREDSADRIGSATRMDARGWPWRLYKPLVETVMALDLPIIGADLPRATVKRIVAKKLDALDIKRVRALALDQPLSRRDSDIMRADIVAAHCGYTPHARLDGMIAAQRARDAMLADALIARGQGDGAVLIAGSGHVRNDLAVPAYLRQRAPGKHIASVAFTEVNGGKPAPDDYLRGAAADGEASEGLWDYLWFTPGSQPPDPCAAFEKRLRRLRQPESRSNGAE